MGASCACIKEKSRFGVILSSLAFASRGEALISQSSMVGTMWSIESTRLLGIQTIVDEDEQRNTDEACQHQRPQRHRQDVHQFEGKDKCVHAHRLATVKVEHRQREALYAEVLLAPEEPDNKQNQCHPCALDQRSGNRRKKRIVYHVMPCVEEHHAQE